MEVRMRLGDIMSADVFTIGPDEPVGAAWREMRRHRIRHLAVAEDGDLVGVVSERDLGGGKEPPPARNRTVRDIMTTPPGSVAPATTLRQAANRMRGHTIGSLLVVDHGKLVGVVTTTDLLDLLGRGATRPTVRTEAAPVRRAPATGAGRGRRAVRRATGPRRGRRTPRPSAQ